MPTTREIIFAVRDQSFDITVTGLLPTTYHYFYFEGKRDTTNVKQYGKKIGETLISDANGQITFTYYYKSGLPEYASTLQEYYAITNNIAGRKEVVVSNINLADLPSDFADSSTSFAKSFIEISIYQPTEKDFEYGFSER